jgi:hypothetical protein
MYSEAQMRRHIFWPLIIFGSLLLALAGASFSAALFSLEFPSNIALVGSHAVFGRIISLDWSADRGFLVGAICLGVGGVTALVIGARSR